jgi:hypothetical protein
MPANSPPAFKKYFPFSAKSCIIEKGCSPERQTEDSGERGRPQKCGRKQRTQQDSANAADRRNAAENSERSKTVRTRQTAEMRQKTANAARQCERSRPQKCGRKQRTQQDSANAAGRRSTAAQAKPPRCAAAAAQITGSYETQPNRRGHAAGTAAPDDQTSHQTGIYSRQRTAFRKNRARAAASKKCGAISVKMKGNSL